MEVFEENHEKLFGLNRMLRHGSFDFFSLKYFDFSESMKFLTFLKSMTKHAKHPQKFKLSTYFDFEA